MAIDEFVDHFLSGNLYFGDYHLHTTSWMNGCEGRIRQENLLVLRYEDLVENKHESATAINRLIAPGILLDDSALSEVVNSTGFDTMKENITKNPGTFHFNPSTFFRSGKTNDWIDKLSADSISKIDQKTKEVWKKENRNSTSLRA